MMAARSLSQERIQERMQRHRHAVYTRAMQRAKTAVKDRLRAEGKKVHHFSLREITLLAEEYFKQHAMDLITRATEDINTSPCFERWRLPSANISSDAQKQNEPRSVTSTVQMSGAQ